MAAPNPARPAEVKATSPRLKNWRRVTPIVSGSGGTYGTGALGATFSSSAERSAATAASSTSRPVGAGRDLDLLVGPARPVALAGLPRERALAAARVVPAGGHDEDPDREHEQHDDDADDGAGVHRPTSALVGAGAAAWLVHSLAHGRHHRSKKIPLRQGRTKFCPGPRKKEPMRTRTAQNIMKMVKTLMANLRSSGLLLGLRST